MKAMAVPLDAEDLAEFANLKTDEDAAGFQRKTTGRDTGPDFAPASWWTYPATRDDIPEPKQWMFTQRLVREAWKQKFQSDKGLFDTVRLLLSVFNPQALKESAVMICPEQDREEVVIVSTVSACTKHGNHTLADVDETREEYGFHKAIRYLAGGPAWRVKTCEYCHGYFVADHNGRKCCSVKCSSDHQIERQQDHARDRNWYRPNKSARISSPRLPGSRSEKRKTDKPASR